LQTFEVLKLAVLVGVNVYIADYIVSYQLLVGLPGLALIRPPACPQFYNYKSFSG
jgi:hypothetical protein